MESYAVVFVEAVRGAPSADEVLERADLARLLLGETTVPELSDAERADVTRRHFSYGGTTWWSSTGTRPSSTSPRAREDIPDILEIANAQLLELRYYDDVLDQQPGPGERDAEARATTASAPSSAAPTRRWPGRSR